MLITTRSTNDCVPVALANHFGIDYNELTRWLAQYSASWRDGKGVELSLVRRLTDECLTRVYGLQVAFPTWSPWLTPSGILICQRGKLWHVASVYRGKMLTCGGTFVPLTRQRYWTPVELLPVEPAAGSPIMKFHDTCSAAA